MVGVYPTWRCGLRDGLVDAGVEAAADGDVVGGGAGLPPLVPQLLLTPPLRSPVGEPHLPIGEHSTEPQMSEH